MEPEVELKAEERRLASEPGWETGNLESTCTQKITIQKGDAVQQSDMLKPFYMTLVRQGLDAAYKEYSKDDPFDPPSYVVQSGHISTQPRNSRKRKIIIIGAGMAGMAAAYELKRVGHDVQILEMQERVGGRVKTFAEKEGFAKGLYVDGGAMRLPGWPHDTKKKHHYLTDYYIDHLGLKRDLAKFNNQDDNAFLKFYNMEPVTYTEWNKDDKGVFDDGFTSFCKTWPNWNSLIKDKHPEIKNINAYFEESVKKIKDQLTSRLEGTHTYTEAAAIWQRWINNWSQFSVNGLLLSKKSEVLSKLSGDKEYHDEIKASNLGDFIPWPEEAITAWTIYNYTEQLDQSLVQYLRDELGDWWSPKMHHINGGMSKLPQAFYEKLKQDITFNVTVTGIKYTATAKDDVKVEVTGYYSNSGQPCSFEGDAAIVTTPIHIIRQIKMERSEPPTPQFPKVFYQAIEDIWYGPSTKIMIQTKSRFWLKGDNKIKGGFSKTNLPIGQLHYPTHPEDVEPPEKGILLIYTWKSEALQFGALNPQIAIREAVRQIGEIHKDVDMEKEWEVGAVQAWYNEPSSQGAYVLLKPNQYRNIARLWYYPFLNIFFAGEGISFAAGWIQGALESGLRAAYQFYARNEENKLHCIKLKK